MSLTTQLHLKQQQKLVMTPMLQQALKILQMNSLELNDLIKQEISENPMLEEMEAESEVAAPEAEADAPAEAEAPEPEAPAALEGAEIAEAPEIKESQDAVDAPKDESWEDYFDDNGTDYAGMGEKGGEEKDGFESFLSARPSLQEHLLAQLDAESMDDAMRELCEKVIGAVNERGYFEGDAGEGRSFEALRRVQRMDPPGVGARN